MPIVAYTPNFQINQNNRDENQIVLINLCKVEFFSIVLFSLHSKDKHNLLYKTNYEPEQREYHET